MQLRSVAPLTFTIAAVAVAAFFMPHVGEVLQYDRAAMLDGQWWRALTGHMVHWSGEHLFWDVAMFAVLGWVLERRGARQFALAGVAAAGTISGVLWFAQPEMPTYRGLSGVDTALFAMLAVTLLLESLSSNARQGLRGREGFSVEPATTSERRWPNNRPDPIGSAALTWFASRLPAGLLIGLLAKIGYEYATGATLFVGANAGFTPVPLAHLIGAAVGVATAWISCRQHDSLALAP
jgi:rhomboid family GlyGly-CTERM serine protease